MTPDGTNATGTPGSRVSNTIMEEEEEEEPETNITQTGLQEKQTGESTSQSIRLSETQSTNSDTIHQSSEKTADTQSISNTQSQSSDFKIPEVSRTLIFNRIQFSQLINCYCKTLIFGRYFYSALLAVLTKIGKIWNREKADSNSVTKYAINGHIHSMLVSVSINQLLKDL